MSAEHGILMLRFLITVSHIKGMWGEFMGDLSAKFSLTRQDRTRAGRKVASLTKLFQLLLVTDQCFIILIEFAISHVMCILKPQKRLWFSQITNYQPNPYLNNIIYCSLMNIVFAISKVFLVQSYTNFGYTDFKTDVSKLPHKTRVFEQKWTLYLIRLYSSCYKW